MAVGLKIKNVRKRVRVFLPKRITVYQNLLVCYVVCHTQKSISDVNFRVPYLISYS